MPPSSQGTTSTGKSAALAAGTPAPANKEDACPTAAYEPTALDDAAAGNHQQKHHRSRRMSKLKRHWANRASAEQAAEGTPLEAGEPRRPLPLHNATGKGPRERERERER
jgi:hypothetical protein